MRQIRGLLDLVATLAILGAAVVVVVNYPGMADNKQSSASTAITEFPPIEVPVGSAPTLGRTDATIGIMLFSDFECQFCKHFALGALAHLKTGLIDEGKALLIFKHFPLESTHPNARRVSELAACAQTSSSFWLAHDTLFEFQASLDAVSVDVLAGRMSDSSERLRQCAATEGRATVNSDILLGRSLDVTGTPSFLIGRLQAGVLRATVRLEGAQPIGVFDEAIDSLVKPGR